MSSVILKKIERKTNDYYLSILLYADGHYWMNFGGYGNTVKMSGLDYDDTMLSGFDPVQGNDIGVILRKDGKRDVAFHFNEYEQETGYSCTLS